MLVIPTWTGLTRKDQKVDRTKTTKRMPVVVATAGAMIVLLIIKATLVREMGTRITDIAVSKTMVVLELVPAARIALGMGAIQP